MRDAGRRAVRCRYDPRGDHLGHDDRSADRRRRFTGTAHITDAPRETTGIVIALQQTVALPAGDQAPTACPADSDETPGWSFPAAGGTSGDIAISIPELPQLIGPWRLCAYLVEPDPSSVTRDDPTTIRNVYIPARLSRTIRLT